MRQRRLALRVLPVLLIVPFGAMAQAGEMKLSMMDMMMSMPQSAGQGGSGMQSGQMGAGGGMMMDNMMQRSQGQMGSSSAPMGSMTMGDNKMQMPQSNMASTASAPHSGAGAHDPAQAGPVAPGRTQSIAELFGAPERFEGRIAFLRAELRITSAQAGAWDRFAEGLRQSRSHVMAARAALQQASATVTPPERLEQYEQHLRAQADSLRVARAAFSELYGTLDAQQKATADQLLLPFLAIF